MRGRWCRFVLDRHPFELPLAANVGPRRAEVLVQRVRLKVAAHRRLSQLKCKRVSIVGVAQYRVAVAGAARRKLIVVVVVVGRIIGVSAGAVLLCGLRWKSYKWRSIKSR